MSIPKYPWVCSLCFRCGLEAVFLVAAGDPSLDSSVVLGIRFWGPGLGWCPWLSPSRRSALPMCRSSAEAVCPTWLPERATW